MHGSTVIAVVEEMSTAYDIRPTERIARFNNRDIPLTNRDYDLLLYLLRNRGRTITRAELLERVWGLPSTVQTRTVDVHIARVRKALRAAGDHRLMIRAQYGGGYRVFWGPIGRESEAA